MASKDMPKKFYKKLSGLFWLYGHQKLSTLLFVFLTDVIGRVPFAVHDVSFDNKAHATDDDLDKQAKTTTEREEYAVTELNKTESSKEGVLDRGGRGVANT